MSRIKQAAPAVAYIIGTYPLVTTTFIDREVQRLRELGVRITILSIRRPPPEVEQMEEYRAIRGQVTYLLPADRGRLIAAHIYFALTRPLTYWPLLARLLSRPHPGIKQRLKTLLHFGEGVYAAFLLRNWKFGHIHAHFVDRAATVALCVGRLLERPYSVTAHANDLYANPVMLCEKIEKARFAVTVSKFNKEHILENCPGVQREQISVLHPWVDLNDFQPPAVRPPHSHFQILSVGRLVEKKGHRYLIESCKLLAAKGIEFKCAIIGGGPLEGELRALVNDCGLADRVEVLGAQPKSEVLRRLCEADVFVLASVIAQDGDRDGMPVVLAEAMAMQVPVVSTDIVGIGELVQPGAGYLVPPRDAAALGDALAALEEMGPAARSRMGQRGRAIVAAEFEVNKGTSWLAELFNESDTHQYRA